MDVRLGSITRLVRHLFRKQPLEKASLIPDECLAPLAKAYTPRSILRQSDPKEAFQPTRPVKVLQDRFVGEKSRTATCSGVTWIDDHHLVTGNVRWPSLHVYQFDPPQSELKLVQSIEDSPCLDALEQVAASRDGRLLAVTDHDNQTSSIFRIDRQTHRIDPEPIATVRNQIDRNLHGIGFSPCGRVLAFTTVDEPGLIRLYRLRWIGEVLKLEELPVFETRFSPSRPKGVDFSPDGKWVAICFSLNAGIHPISDRDNRLAIFRFDHVRGIHPRHVAITDTRVALGACDDVRFLPSGEHVLLTEQETDQVSILPWNAQRRRLGQRRVICQSKASELSFPHGIGVSPSGRYFAVTNYGDDSVVVFKTPGRSAPGV